MGECGCAATEINVKFPAPDGGKYGLEVYSSCHYCNTPAGIVLHRFDRDSQDGSLFLDGVPDVEFHEYGDFGQHAIPILDPEVLADELQGKADDEFDVDERREVLADALPEAVRKTLDQWRGRGG